MAKYKQHIVQKDGWTDWIYPSMKNYKMACCDCGLTHDIKMKVIAQKIIRKFKNGTYEHVILPERISKKYAVAWKVKRNNRATAQIRKHNNKSK